MIHARHVPFYVTFFNFYSRFMLNRHFDPIRIFGKYEPDGKAVLLLSNHFSWWDGFIGVYANLHLFHKKFHVMMLEEQLKTRMFLNKAGAYSILRKNRSVKESLDYTSDILTHQENMVLMFPQGEIKSAYTRYITFEKGIEYILTHLENNVSIYFMAMLTDYFSRPKPSLFLYLEKYKGSLTMEQMETEYNIFFEQTIHKQKER